MMNPFAIIVRDKQRQLQRVQHFLRFLFHINNIAQGPLLKKYNTCHLSSVSILYFIFYPAKLITSEI